MVRKLRLKEFVQKLKDNADIKSLCRILGISFNNLEYIENNSEFSNHNTYILNTTGNTAGDCNDKIRSNKKIFRLIDNHRKKTGDYIKMYDSPFGLIYIDYDNNKSGRSKIIMVPSDNVYEMLEQVEDGELKNYKITLYISGPDGDYEETIEDDYVYESEDAAIDAVTDEYLDRHPELNPEDIYDWDIEIVESLNRYNNTYSKKLKIKEFSEKKKFGKLITEDENLNELGIGKLYFPDTNKLFASYNYRGVLGGYYSLALSNLVLSNTELHKELSDEYDTISNFINIPAKEFLDFIDKYDLIVKDEGRYIVDYVREYKRDSQVFKNRQEAIDVFQDFSNKGYDIVVFKDIITGEYHRFEPEKKTNKISNTQNYVIFENDKAYEDFIYNRVWNYVDSDYTKRRLKKKEVLDDILEEDDLDIIPRKDIKNSEKNNPNGVIKQVKEIVNDIYNAFQDLS